MWKLAAAEQNMNKNVQNVEAGTEVVTPLQSMILSWVFLSWRRFNVHLSYLNSAEENIRVISYNAKVLSLQSILQGRLVYSILYSSDTLKLKCSLQKQNWKCPNISIFTGQWQSTKLWKLLRSACIWWPSKITKLKMLKHSSGRNA